MPYQLSWQSVRKNCETPVQLAGSVGVTRGGALVTRSTSAASAPFGPDKIPAAKIATAMPLFHITNSPPRKQSLATAIDQGIRVPVDRTRPCRSGQHAICAAGQSMEGKMFLNRVVGG